MPTPKVWRDQSGTLEKLCPKCSTWKAAEGNYVRYGNRTLVSGASTWQKTTCPWRISSTCARPYRRLSVVKKAFQDKNGGLNAAGRAHFKKTEGANLKPPAPNPKNEKDAARRKSFCARSAGQAAKFPSAAKDPDSRLNKARKAWNC